MLRRLFNNVFVLINDKITSSTNRNKIAFLISLKFNLCTEISKAKGRKKRVICYLTKSIRNLAIK